VTLRRLGPLALALAAACGSSTPAANIRFLEPTAVAVFHGITVKSPGAVKPYVAIANAGREDLTLVDAVDDTAVIAPVVLRTLAVPTVAPRPSLLVSAGLGDEPAGADATTHRPDLLIAVGAGSSVLEVIRTWADDGVAAVAQDQLVDLSALAGAGVEVVAAIATPAIDATGAATPGHVRIVAALSGRRLAVVEYRRAATGNAIEVVPGAATVETLTFQPLSLAVNPGAPSHVYAATLDPLQTSDGRSVLGVAELDATLAPGSWGAAIRPLDARGPTRLVAAATVEERKPDSAGNFPAENEASDPFQPAADRVYAFLDPTGCGVDQRIGCGIAVLDPATAALVPDYAQEMPYLAPIAVPSVPVAFAISKPPAKPIDASSTDVVNGDALAVNYMKLVAGTGIRASSAVAVVAAGDGRAYLVDLSRWQVPTDQSLLRDTSSNPSRTRPSAMATVTVVDQEPDPKFIRARELGVWDVSDPANPQFLSAATGDTLSRVVRVTPGYTPSDTWRIRYQGPLPGLGMRGAETGRTGDGRTWLAMQRTTQVSGGPAKIIDVARLYDPTLAVHVDDIVVIAVDSTLALVPQCQPLQATPTTAARDVETRVAAVLAPTDAYPGGAVVVEPLAGPNGTTQWKDCFDAAIAPQPTLTGLRAAVLAGAYVMVGDATGYAGRPVLEVEPNVDVPAFGLRYQDEDTLACPVLPWPVALPTDTAAPFYACTDATCRTACENLVLARKARRTYHLADACNFDQPAGDLRCRELWPPELYQFPRATGPVISFRLALRERFAAAAGTTETPPEPSFLTTPDRALELDFTTVSALFPTSRRPPSGTGTVVLPTGGIATFDRSLYRNAESYRFFVTFGSDVVLDFSPALAQNTGNVLR
jgi:hypothetical protein